jgi:site-specific DNA recombinase
VARTKSKNGKRVAVGYLRVSTAGQATEGVSLEAQAERVTAAAAAAGFELATIEADRGVSGKRADNRPGLQQAIEAACKSRGVLVVYSLSRMSRSVADTLAIADRLERAGADLVSLTESIDTTTAAGKMMFRMLSVLAEFERDLVSERTAGALAHKKATGERVGGIPFGSRLAADGVALVPDDAEQAVIALVRQLAAAGESTRAIAERLNTDGVATRTGGRWHQTQVVRILRAA